MIYSGLNRGDYLGDDVRFLRIGELAELAGVSPRTIDYYTQLGLLIAARSPGKHRLYCEESLKTVKIIKELQKQHYSLDEICHLLDGKEIGDLFEKMVRIRQHLDSLQKEMAELYPAIQLTGSDQQVRIASKELATKGLQVLQVLMVLLGEPMI